MSAPVDAALTILRALVDHPEILRAISEALPSTSAPRIADAIRKAQREESDQRMREALR